MVQIIQVVARWKEMRRWSIALYGMMAQTDRWMLWLWLDTLIPTGYLQWLVSEGWFVLSTDVFCFYLSLLFFHYFFHSFHFLFPFLFPLFFLLFFHFAFIIFYSLFPLLFPSFFLILFRANERAGKNGCSGVENSSGRATRVKKRFVLTVLLLVYVCVYVWMRVCMWVYVYIDRLMILLMVLDVYLFIYSFIYSFLFISIC